MFPISQDSPRDSMFPATSQTNQTASSSNANSGTTQPATGGSQVTKNMFLQLLVAQIKNQDPLNPSDGAQFLTQLAQFQQMEQSMNMGQDIAAIRGDLDQATAPQTGTTTGTN